MNGSLTGTGSDLLLRPALLAALSWLLSGCALHDLLAASPHYSESAIPSAAADPSPDAARSEAERSKRSDAQQEPAAPKPQLESTASASADLWVRVRAGLRLSHSRNPKIRQELKWLAKHQKYLDRVSSRANRYLFHVVEEIERRGLPGELALLPIIESAYQPFAQSPGGASGIWQFIRSTGRRYGLKQNWWYDGRRDIVESTRAALSYLQQLNSRYKGDWLLTLAAYNCGEGTVQRAIQRNQGLGKGTDFWSLRLPPETRGYVPRLLAVAQVVADPDRHGLSFAPLPNTPYFSVVELEHQIDLGLAADLAEISIEELYKLNPGFNRWATDPDGPHRLLIPVANAARLRASVAELPPQRLVTWKRHHIQAGETLGEIALEHHTTVATLKRANRLSDTMIRAGSSLIAPAPQRRLRSYTLSADARDVVKAQRPKNAEESKYVVRNGDTLWEIARHHGTSVEQLRAWNAIGSTRLLHPGQELSIWHLARGPEAQSVTAPSNAPAPSVPGHLRYTVKRGDSLWEISRRFKVSVVSLRKWNSLAQGKLLHPGQELHVYLESSPQLEI